MKIELIVGDEKYIGESKPDEELIANVDFEGHFMVQIDLRDMTFTGRGMDGYNIQLTESFYRCAKIKELK